MRLILGSQSPRRKQLLESAGFSFEIRVSHTPEDYPADMPLQEVPVYLAEKKATALLPTMQAREVLVCADSVVIWQGELLGKPTDFEDGKRILQKLSGSTHEVITAVCVATTSTRESFAEHTWVTFHTLSEAEITHYLTTAQPFDKAGSYGIQDWIGLIGVKEVKGCFYNVMGLPVAKVYQALKKYTFEK